MRSHLRQGDSSKPQSISEAKQIPEITLEYENRRFLPFRARKPLLRIGRQMRKPRAVDNVRRTNGKLAVHAYFSPTQCLAERNFAPATRDTPRLANQRDIR